MIRVHVRQKPDRAKLQLYYVDPLTGEDVTRSAKTSDWKAAERAAADWEREIADKGNPENLSWEQFRVRYSDEWLPFKSLGTRRVANNAMNQFEAAVGRPRKLAAINASVFSQCSAAWRRAGMADATIGGYLGHLRTALRWAVRVGFLDKPPRLPMPKLPERHMKGRPVANSEARLMLRATKVVCGTHWRMWVRFQHGLWLSGLRISEAVALSWDRGPVQVDLTTGRHPRLRFKAEGQKGRRDELAPITPDFARWLARTPVAGRHGAVLPLLTKYGKPVTCLHNVGEKLSEIGKAAGIYVTDQGKPASAHDLRRAFGTRWANRVKPITLKALMRHKSINTTLAYYVEQDSDDVADALWE